MVYSTKLRSIAASGLLVGSAAAAGCSAPKGGVLVVDVDEALDLASCKTFDGSIAISRDVWDSISLDGIEEITGSLSIEEGADTLTYFSANSLTSVGSLGLHEAPILTGFDLPSLSKIDSISLSSLPLLWDVDFGESIEKCSSVEVRDSALTKLELDIAEPDTIIIEENDYLWSVSISSTTVNEEISIGANGNALDISFPQLESASKVTMSNASALSFPALTNIDSLIIKDSYIVEEGFDFSSLETVSGDLEISGVWDVSSLSLSSLKSVGGDLKVRDNGFSSVNFESLETVGGDMELSGDIEEVTMDELTEVFGSFDVSGASNAQFDCHDWSSSVKGKSSCKKDNDDEPPAEASVSISRSTPVASVPTDLASTPVLSTSSISIPATPTPIAASPSAATPSAASSSAATPGRPSPVTAHSTPGGVLTPKPLASTPVVISLQTPIVETVTNCNGSVKLTTETWATSTPGEVFGTPTPTPSNPVSPFRGDAVSVRPFVGMVGFIAAMGFLVLLRENYLQHAELEQCDALIEAGLGNSLLFATDLEYKSRISSWWALNDRSHPWCLFQPKDTGEVSTGISALLDAGGGAGYWHIAIRSGGHGHGNNIDAGVTIDLGKLNQTTYNKETNLASIGPGGKWKDVYAKLHEQGALVTGGRDGNVGVGGFLLGGGLTYYMGREAFGCDSVKNFEVVLANGTVVNANEDQNTDLWMALKGGGSNFGIVTRFDMEALPDNKLAHGIRFMSGNYSSELVDVLVHFTDHYQDFETDALVGFIMHNTSITQEGTVAVAIHVNTEGVHNSTGFDKLNRIPPLLPDETRSLSLAEAAESSQLAYGTWNTGATITFHNDRRILSRAVALHEEFTKDLGAAIGAKNFQSMVFFQPLSTFFSDISNRKGGNMLGLDEQEHNAIIWTAFVAVTTDQLALAIAQTRMIAMAAELRRFAALSSAGVGLVYMNYADLSQDPLGSYGRKNVDFIRDVATKYDPTGAFQARVPGGFKISRVDV